MEKYGNYERGYPQVLNGLVLKGFRKEFVGKDFLGPTKFFQVQPPKTELRDISACQGLKVHFGMVLDRADAGKLFASCVLCFSFFICIYIYIRATPGLCPGVAA